MCTYVIVSRVFQDVPPSTSMSTCHDGLSSIAGLRSNMLRNRFLIVVSVIGEGIGQRRIAGPKRKNIHSVVT